MIIDVTAPVELVPIKNLPELSIRALSVPPADTETVSALGKNIPVLLSPLGLIDGALVEPEPTDTELAVTIPVVFTLLEAPTPTPVN
jgi:hypothetical protein